MKKLVLKPTINITLIAEFNNTASDEEIREPLEKLSNYIYDCFNGSKFIVITDLQSHPKGYRVTYRITLPFKQKYYVSKLAKLTWLSNLQSLSRYYYNIEGNNNGYTI